MMVKTVGRGPENSIVVNDDRISRTHLQMVQDDNGNISVVDLGSTNGTFVNGNRIASETRLRPSDELRIGNTVLPWQSYFNAPQPTSSQAHTSSALAQPSAPKRNRIWLYIAGGVLLVIFIVVGIVLVNGKKKERDEKEQKMEQRRNLEMELKDAKTSAAIANAEYEAALRTAAETKSEKDLHRADSLRIVANQAAEAEKKAKSKLEKQVVAAENQVTEANKKAQEAEAAAAKANEETTKAKEAENNARQQAEEEKNKAEAARDETRLTQEFYKRLNSIKGDKNKLKDACKELKIEYSGKPEDLYNHLMDKFVNAKDNKEREKIVKAMGETVDSKKNTEDVDTSSIR